MAEFWQDWPLWKQWKAQLIAESNLKPGAISPVGARGVAQFMPATWEEVAEALSIEASPHDPEAAIRAGAFYMRRQRGQFPLALPSERQRLAQAAYNAGAGNIKRAARLCQSMRWSVVSSCLPRVTGHHAAETQGYVARIERIWGRL